MFAHKLRPLLSNFITRNLKLSGPLNQENTDKYLEEILYSDRDYLSLTENYLNIKQSHNCYIIQPYIKWGKQKLKEITTQEQLDEAKALILTLPKWTISATTLVPLETFDMKKLFGTGTIERLNQEIKNTSSTAVFVNLSTLKRVQIQNLEKIFQRPIFDRYKIVMQIFKYHATSKHAKLQVALAELYYLKETALNSNIIPVKNKEKFRLMFHNKEQKLKEAIEDIRRQRNLLRNRRSRIEYPIIAVVGYTNAGKTSLVKALTGDEKLEPKDQLFATLDVTLHMGLLPSGLEVLYVDTVGFISDIPTNLIESFVATLEDAVLADLILHVEDVSSASWLFKRKNVLKTLENLGVTTTDKVLSVGNKCDLLNDNKDFSDLLLVSAKTSVGLDALKIKIQNEIIRLTNRKIIKIKLPAGSEELNWLQKNSIISYEEIDKTNEFVIVNVIITNSKLQQFKHHFFGKQ